MTAQSFHLRPVMRHGTAASIPEAWNQYTSREKARTDAKHMYHDDRVLRVLLVRDDDGSSVEWIDDDTHAA